MTNKPKTPSEPKKPGGLASLVNQRQSEEDIAPDYPEEAYTQIRTDPLAPRRGLPRPLPPRLKDPEDLRTERYGLRLHPDLRLEMESLARAEGFKLSQWIERALVDTVNRVHGRHVLDRIGRRIQGK